MYSLACRLKFYFRSRRELFPSFLFEISKEEDMGISDQKRLEQGFKVFKWTKTVSRLVGLWPFTPNYYLFNVYICYITGLLTLNLILLYKSLEDIEKFIDILIEGLGVLFLCVFTLMVRVNNYKIGQVMSQAISDYHISSFRDSQEIKVFMQFMNKAAFISKVLIIYILFGELIWYFGPLMAMSSVEVDDDNKTVFTLPYQIYIFYEIDSAKLYYLTYLCLMPAGYIAAIANMTTDCILISLVFYISGKMSVLTMRIDTLKSNQHDCKNELSEIIYEHGKLLQYKMGDTLRDSYSFSLLVYFVVINFLICILGYRILTSIMADQIVEAMDYIMYLVEIYAILGLFCTISEHLTAESLKCEEAFYHCNWYDFPLDCRKNLILCIKRSQKPMVLSVGKFTTLSIVTLTDVTKTAVGYLSILRNFLIVD